MSEMRSIITGATSRSLVLIDEICRGTETAKGTCIAGSIVETLDKIGCLGEVYNQLSRITGGTICPKIESTNEMEVLHKKVESAVTIVCQKKLKELYKQKNTSKLPEINCVAILPGEQPPPSTIGASSVYVLFSTDKKLYVGETDDLEGRVRAHRSKEGMQKASFLYFVVPGKSLACQLETLLINQLPVQGFQLVNRADGKHRNFGTLDHSVEVVTLHQ
ncbi:DNA mismatch repair protein MSH1, mitochondrial [Vitis vinifera]|uniref:DNA mismatch repair protein MSH1, mitochondrial n=1 Tax=Vitis vinifera TaxID=29760 RepID=A0A438DHM8_VITVI|nr:DNA mismatch repair protein MSH1, mitochondrial [Vitis vinifera]